MSNSDDFWLISIPGDKTPQESYEKLSKNISATTTPCKFNIPNLKVGTLDQLFGLSDELGKLDAFVEA
jgi:V-type H+-transporting ATPase subunit C